MLIEFAVENFRSIQSRQVLSMAATALQEHRSENVLESPAPATPSLLRSAIIYGANAAGKSNLLKAIAAFERLVCGPKNRSRESKLEFQPFLLDPESQNRPTTFEVSFVEGGVRYQYGVKYNADRFLYEGLFAYPEGRAQRWFERIVLEDGTEEFEFGGYFRGQKKVWQDATRPNDLFLSTAVSLNSEQLAPVYSWFDERIRSIYPYARVNEKYTASASSDPHRKLRIMDFLAQADLGISDFEVVKVPFEDVNFPEDAPEGFVAGIREILNGKEFDNVSFLHRSKFGHEVRLSLDDESGGTSKLFSLAGPWIDVLENGYILIVDELDTSLHPMMMKYLIRAFHDPAVNRNGAQLIFTTHDTNALSLFRRDQIWFMEKTGAMDSVLVPLADFSARKGENIEKGYLEGRFGGVPVLGRFSLGEGISS